MAPLEREHDADAGESMKNQVFKKSDPLNVRFMVVPVTDPDPSALREWPDREAVTVSCIWSIFSASTTAVPDGQKPHSSWRITSWTSQVPEKSAGGDETGVTVAWPEPWQATQRARQTTSSRARCIDGTVRRNGLSRKEFTGGPSQGGRLPDLGLADPPRPLDEVAVREDDVGVVGVRDQDVLLAFPVGVVLDGAPPGILQPEILQAAGGQLLVEAGLEIGEIVADGIARALLLLVLFREGLDDHA